MKYNELINELFDILDNNYDVIKIKDLKNKLIKDKNFINSLEDYRLVKTINNKKKLYENKDYLEYLKSETNINILIQNIKNKFSIFNNRKCLK